VRKVSELAIDTPMSPANAEDVISAAKAAPNRIFFISGFSSTGGVRSHRVTPEHSDLDRRARPCQASAAAGAARTGPTGSPSRCRRLPSIRNGTFVLSLAIYETFVPC